MTLFVPAVFYRGGTSRGLFLHARDLAPFRAEVRDRIICAAMGSPDPDGRQIDGLGGGVSSLSKTALISRPGEPYTAQIARGGSQYVFPGVPWADDPARASDPESGWDIIYRFGQVPVREGTTIDWGSTCGNLLSAAALFAVHYCLPPEHFEQHAARAHVEGNSMRLPVRILQACTGERVVVNVPLVRDEHVWRYSDICDTAIAGVPGRAPGMTIEAPINRSTLPTGQPKDIVEVDGKHVAVSVVDAGLPVIFVDASTLGLSTEEYTGPVQTLDANAQMHAAAERVRQQVALRFEPLARVLSPSAPKICIIHPRTTYTTSSGESLGANDIDMLVRAISVGNVHRSVPATTLAALAASMAYPDSVIGEALRSGGAHETPSAASTALAGPSTRAITVGHPAGAASASVALKDGSPAALLYTRTARRIMQGLVEIPPNIASTAAA
ncbi:hypothetical protein MCUN1_002992 [Malassezia cuniculi]|uniref:3-methylitaconate isomerase n=1 Tax=Malassezia cuniculi TaxID=948313 RepID=A0AAF0JCP4_9BASI|nr:hypothetical protein MCUN1_002992 [Malassezia cuniculi]